VSFQNLHKSNRQRSESAARGQLGWTETGFSVVEHAFAHRYCDYNRPIFIQTQVTSIFGKA
jgi:hypothetical protein